MKLKSLLTIGALSWCGGGSLSAQSPGGLTPAAWYNAADGTYADLGITAASNNSTLQQWNSNVGAFPLIQNSAGSRPVYNTTNNQANFNPTVSFDGRNDWMQFTAPTGVNIIDRVNGTIYVAGYMNQQKRSGFAGFQASMDYPGLHVYSNYKLLFYTAGGPGYQGLSDTAIKAQSFFNSGGAWQNGAAYAASTVSLNGTRKDYNGSQINNVNVSNSTSRNFRIGADNNYGSFSGQINEVLVFEEKLTALEMSRLESYLAVKYGTTLGYGNVSYVNSSGVDVWSPDPTYKHNVAAIARDSAGALLQKQSWSTNAGQQVLIGVGGLANTNAENLGTLSDGQFLFWADNGLEKSPTVNVSGFPTLSHRFSAIWMVQNPGAVGTVRISWPKGLKDLSIIQSTDAIIAAGDVVTPMSGEITINGVVYNYADVTLSNNTYFTLAAKLAAPGGVSDNLRVWLRADEGFSPSIWQDVSGLGNHYTQTNASRQPFTAASLYNYNPVIDFGKTGNDGRFMVVPSGKPYSANGSNSSIFTVNLDRSVSSYADIIGFGNTTTGTGYIQANFPAYTRHNTYTYLYPTSYPNTPTMPPVVVNKLYINDASFTIGTSPIKYGQNGFVSTRNQSYSTTNSKHASGSVLGSQVERRNGLIAEVIAYERDLTEPEKQRVRTYTAIKYGITLPHDYWASDGTTIVWNTTTNTGYNNNISGIANDPLGALNQKQSSSINPGQQVLISTSGLGNNNGANTVSLLDNQYLVWGDNGLGKVPSLEILGVPNVNYRFKAVWKVQNTQSVGTVRVAWPTGLTNLTLLQSTDPTFATISASSPMTSSTVSVNGIAYNYVDVTLTNGQYFTFAAQLNGPGGVGTDLRVWLRSDAGFDPTEWTDLSGNENNYTQTNITRQPFVATNLFNFNPVVDFGGSASADGRFMVVPSGKPYSSNTTSSTMFVATLSKSVSGWQDILGFGGTTTGSGLGAADYPSFTTYYKKLQVYPATVSSLPDIMINKLYIFDASYTYNQSGVHYGQNGQLETVAYNLGNRPNNANGSILGSQSGENRNGPIGEVVAYERDLTEAEKQRVRSYIAIKYGITLPHNYVASNGSTIVYDHTINAGFNNNIAGIVRDDHGSLNQRQSWSINSGREILISTIGMSDQNANNTVMLEDQKFLLWGDNGLVKSPSIPFDTTNGLPYQRFSAVWKAQNTGNVGTVRVAWPKTYASMKVIQHNTDPAFSSGAITTPMDAIQVINGKEYFYADVTITNGQYFTLAAFVHAPGGVASNLSHWYRADMQLTSDGPGTEVREWTDFASGVSVQQIQETVVPFDSTGSENYFNYNPGVHFSNDHQKIGNLSDTTLRSLNYDIFTMAKFGSTANTRIFSIGKDNSTFNSVTNWNQPGLNISGTVSRRTANAAGTHVYEANPGNVNFPSNAPSIMYYTFTDSTVAKGLNGAPNGAIGTNNSNTKVGQSHGGHIFGTNGNGFPGGTEWGMANADIGELIIYGKGKITATERNKVESYLAIKYGLTLDNTNNYTTSKDVVVWTAADNIGNSHNIAGIGNDFISALNQKQSKSQLANTNNQLIIGLGGIYGNVNENTNALEDGEFLIWGDNGYTQAMTNTATSYTSFIYEGNIDNGRRLKRIWKVQNTNLSKEVAIRFPRTAVGTTAFSSNDGCAEYVMIFASDSTFATNLVAKSLSFNDDSTSFEIANLFPNGTTYFTFAKVKPWNQGYAYLPDVTEITSNYSNPCNFGDLKFFRSEQINDEKLMGAFGFTDQELDGMTLTIVPEGTDYVDGTVESRLMSRVTYVNSTVAITSSGTVRIYYSSDEMANTIVANAQTNSWFKYDGDDNDVIVDIYSDGRFDSGKAIPMTPSATGVEDGINYVEFDDISSFSSFVYLSSTEIMAEVLPVTLLEFAAALYKDDVMVTWKTASERNNRGFELEHSTDASTWKSEGFINSKAEGGNSSTSLSYEFLDTDPVNGNNYYRLKQVNFDGSVEYSPITKVNISGKASTINLYPNPATTIVYLDGLEDGQVLTIVNTVGKILPVKASRISHQKASLDIAHLVPGVYYIIVANKNDKSSSTHKFIKK